MTRKSKLAPTDPVTEAINDLWFEWAGREGRGSAQYTTEVAAVATTVVLRQPWLLDVLRDFQPRVVPLDVTPEGTYEEATTRWGMNPIWEAVPAELRELVEEEARPDSRAYWARLRAGQS